MTSYGYRGAKALGQTALAAMTGALIYTLWNLQSAIFSWEFLLWLALVGGTTIPVAFVGIALGGLLSASGWRQAPVLTLGCLVGLVASVYLYEFYMTWLVPAINWSRGPLLPAASFVTGFFLALLQRSRFAERENPP